MLNDFILAPKSGVIKTIIVLLHGYGSCGENLMPLGHVWQEALSDTLFIAPNAPEPSDINDNGYQWFGLPDLNPFNIRQGLEKATPLLITYLKQCAKQYNIPTSSIILVGFSQGAILALNTLFEDIPLGAIIGYSGAFFPPLTQKTPQKTPVLLVHGTHDSVVPYASLVQAQTALQTYNVPVEAHTVIGLDHSINEEGLQKGLRFIQNTIRSNP